MEVSVLCVYLFSVYNKFTFWLRAGYEHLDAALHHYDTLHTEQINHSYTRSSASLHHRHVQFHTLERSVQNVSFATWHCHMPDLPLVNWGCCDAEALLSSVNSIKL